MRLISIIYLAFLICALIAHPTKGLANELEGSNAKKSDSSHLPYTQPLNPYAEKAINASLEHDLEKAEKYAKKAIETEPDVASHHTILSVIYYKKGRFDSALQQILITERLTPEDELREFPGTYLNIASLYAKLEKVHEALEYLDKVLATHANYLRAHMLRADIYEQMGEFELAVEEFSLLSKSTDEFFREKGLQGLERLRQKKKKREGDEEPKDHQP